MESSPPNINAVVWMAKRGLPGRVKLECLKKRWMYPDGLVEEITVKV